MITTTIVTDFAIGDTQVLPRTITELPTPISSAQLGIKHLLQDTTPTLLLLTITPVLSSAGQITQPGTLQPDGTYTAQLQFILTGDPDGTTSLFPVGATLYGYIRVFPGPYTSELLLFTPSPGGADG